MFARRAYEPRMAESISPWWFELRGRMGASGLHEWCSAWTRVDSSSEPQEAQETQHRDSQAGPAPGPLMPALSKGAAPIPEGA